MYALLQSGCCAVSRVNSHRRPIASSQFVACCQPDDQRSPQSNPLHLLLPPSSFDSFHRASSKITEPTPVQPIGVISLRGGLLHLRQSQTISGFFFFLQWKLTDMRRLLWHFLSTRRWWTKKKPTNIRHLPGTVGGLSESVSPLLCFFLCGRNISIPPKTTRAELKSPGQREKWKGEKNIRQLRIYGPYQCIGLSCIDKTVSPLSVYRQEEEVKKKCRGENVGRPWAGVDFEPSPPYGFLFFSLNQREP
jgi:hypothetical protein